jgi:nucleotide-binding universal stress UspA family protein
MTDESSIAANCRARESASSEAAEHDLAVFANVLVGVDGTRTGHDAIALGALLHDPDGRMTLAHVSVGIGGASLTFDPVAAHAESLRMLEGERASVGVIAGLTSSASPAVGRGLHRLAEEHAADLLVVGSCRRGLLGRVFLGDDTRASLNGASCAVAVAPQGYAGHPVTINTIGVGYEDTAAGKGALALARSLAARHDARIRALTVISPSSGPTYWAPLAMVDAGGAIAAAEDRLALLEGVEGRVASGVPGEELAAFGGEVDLLIVGSRGYGPVRRLMLGSTSQHLTHSGRCPLLVLPRPADVPNAARARGSRAQATLA